VCVWLRVCVSVECTYMREHVCVCGACMCVCVVEGGCGWVRESALICFIAIINKNDALHYSQLLEEA